MEWNVDIEVFAQRFEQISQAVNDQVKKQPNKNLSHEQFIQFLKDAAITSQAQSLSTDPPLLKGYDYRNNYNDQSNASQPNDDNRDDQHRHSPPKNPSLYDIISHNAYAASEFTQANFMSMSVMHSLFPVRTKTRRLVFPKDSDPRQKDDRGSEKETFRTMTLEHYNELVLLASSSSSSASLRRTSLEVMSSLWRTLREDFHTRLFPIIQHSKNMINETREKILKAYKSIVKQLGTVLLSAFASFGSYCDELVTLFASIIKSCVTIASR